MSTPTVEKGNPGYDPVKDFKPGLGPNPLDLPPFPTVLTPLDGSISKGIFTKLKDIVGLTKTHSKHYKHPVLTTVSTFALGALIASGGWLTFGGHGEVPQASGNIPNNDTSTSVPARPKTVTETQTMTQTETVTPVPEYQTFIPPGGARLTPEEVAQQMCVPMPQDTENCKTPNAIFQEIQNLPDTNNTGLNGAVVIFKGSNDIPTTFNVPQDLYVQGYERFPDGQAKRFQSQPGTPRQIPYVVYATFFRQSPIS